MKNPPKLSDSEWEVIQLIWKKSPISTAEIMGQLSTQKKWKLSTVKTFLDRMVEKKAISFEKENGRYQYRPLIDQEKYIRSESQSFLSRVFGGTSRPAIAQFVETAQLSKKDIQELREVLKRKDGHSPKTS